MHCGVCGLLQGIWLIRNWTAGNDSMVPEFVCTIVTQVAPNLIGDIAMLHTGDMIVSVKPPTPGHCCVIGT